MTPVRSHAKITAMQTLQTLDTRTVSDVLGLSVVQVCRLARSGELPPVAKAPGKRGAYLFDPADVEHFRAIRELQTAGKAAK